jgi:hypothetical protein
MTRSAPLLLLCSVVGAGVAAAEPVLHEKIRPPRGRAGRIVGGPPENPARGEPPRAPAAGEERRENPPAIRSEDKILVEPTSSEPQKAEEVVHGERGIAADRETEARPDYLTGADGTLHYSEVFNPSVVPFKRMSALDAVNDAYTLGVADAKLTTVRVGGDTSSDRDLFWASMVVDLPTNNRAVAIPSVAPDMRILSYETHPRTRLSFLRDGADNFVLRATDPTASGQVRVVFLADAAASYFAPRPPVAAPAVTRREAATLSPRVRRAAELVLARVGVTREDDTRARLDKLVEYFRAFEAGDPPAPSGDIYLDLALSRRGVCRHRAFAFMITANAAGLPARYVTNEAHAFAEVWLEGAGWARIDLGGAALELEVSNAGDKAMHRPRGEDPFPKPREYAENYTQLRGPVDGLSNEQIADAQRPRTPRAAAAGGAEEPGSTDPIAPSTTDLVREPARGDPVRRPVTLTVDSVARKGFRGETVRLSGRAADGADPVAGLRVDIYLAPAGRDGRGARIIGQAITDGDGKFLLAAELPIDLGLGAHEVYAVTPGNAALAPAISE